MDQWNFQLDFLMPYTHRHTHTELVSSNGILLYKYYGNRHVLKHLRAISNKKLSTEFILMDERIFDMG